MSPVVESMDEGATVFGYTVSDLQSDVTVSGNRILGTLKYIDSGSLADVWGEGYFLALNFDDIPQNATVKVGLDPSQGSGLVELDEDHAGVFKITNKSAQKFVMETTVSGKTQRLTYNLSDLVLA